MLLYIGIFAVLATLSWIEIFNGASIKKINASLSRW